MPLAQRPKAAPIQDLAGIDLEMVSELYEAGGEQRVRSDLGLEDWSAANMHKLLARALDEHPIDFERIKVIEGVHPGLAAGAIRESLLSRDPSARNRAAEMVLKQSGIIGADKDPRHEAMEKLTEIIAILAGKQTHDRVIEGRVVEDGALTFPAPPAAS